MSGLVGFLGPYTLKEYFYVISILYGWFLYIPLHQPKNQVIESFDLNKIGTFYINRNNFSQDNKLILLIEKIAKSTDEMSEYLSDSQEVDITYNRKIDKFYKHILKIFDHPIIRINKDVFCIIDLKFFIQGLCSGLLWKLSRLPNFSYKNIKPQYGHLLNKIFDNIKITSDEAGQQEALLKCKDDQILIIEFTTEYYAISSLYNSNLENLYIDLNKILFNIDPTGRKKSKGKFYNLDKYVRTYFKQDNSCTIVVPILVTENYLGDYDMLNQFDCYLTKNIKDNNLDNLLKFKPIILCLDDFELFWSYSKNKIQAADEFLDCLLDWENSEKNTFHYNFSFFLMEYFKTRNLNKEYTKFFDYPSLLSDLEH